MNNNTGAARMQADSKSKISKTVCVFLVLALIIILLLVFGIMYIHFACAIPPQLPPRFMLDDLYVDDDYISNSTLLVKLTTFNPSFENSVHYTKISLHISLESDFETDKFFLNNKKQEPLETERWTSVIVLDNDKPKDEVQVANGAVLAESSIKWKRGIYSSPKFRLIVICPVSINLKDFSSVVSKPMSSCSSHLI